MTARLRDSLLLAAGVPGIVALFLPVTGSVDFPADVVPVEHYWTQLQQAMHWPTQTLLLFWGLDWAVALPILVFLLQARRLLSERDMTRMPLRALFIITLLFQLAAVAGALYEQMQLRWPLPRGWLDLGPDALWVVAPMLALSAVNGWLLHRNWRRGRSPAVTTEMFMMGTYIVAQTFWLQDLLKEPVIAPRLMAWTCLVYAATIALRLRDSRFADGARSHPN